MVHSFPEFELNEDRYELKCGGKPVRVEPRVLEVLTYLVRNPGRVVAKEELLDRVWKKAFVSESALTRCIMESRRAIGDTNREVPLIKTVHGRGYRFDARPRAENAVPVLQAVPPLVETVEPVETEPPADRVHPHRRVAIAGIATAVVLQVTIAAWIALRRPATTTVSGVPTAKIALLPISIASEGDQLQLVGISIADLLEQKLSKIPNVRVRGADYSKPLSDSAETLAAFAAKAGVDYVISGSVKAQPAEARAHLTLTLHQIRAGGVRDTPLGRFDIPMLRHSRDLARYTAVRDRVASQVVATLSPVFQVTTSGNAMTPRDVESYRLYLLARERLAAGTCDGEAAVELLRRSLEIDPNFAPAWNAYAWAEYARASTCTGGAQHHRQALDAAGKALQLAPALGSAVALKAQLIVESGKPDDAYALLHDAERGAPNDADVQWMLASVLTRAGFLDRARKHLDRLDAIDPNYLTQRGVAPTVLLYSGNTKRFLALLPGTDAPSFRFLRGLADVADHRAESAARALEPAFRINPADVYARLSHALLAIIERRPAEAQEIIRQLARQRELVAETDGEMTYRLAQLYALSGDETNALSSLGRAVHQGFFCAPCIESDQALQPLRAAPAYRSAVDVAQRKHDQFAKRFELR